MVADEMIMCWPRSDMELHGNIIIRFGKISNKVGD